MAPPLPPQVHAPNGPSAVTGVSDASRVGTQRWMMLQELCGRLHPDGLGAPKPKMSQLDFSGEIIAEIHVGA